jgi:TRAP-type C4-dicarboxylate transport system permease small subunit
MSSLARGLDRLLAAAIGTLLALMLINVTWQIFTRYVLADPPVWTEEIARYLFVWQIFLGAGLAFGRGAHIVVDVLARALPPVGRRALALVNHALVLALLAFLVWRGSGMAAITADTYATGSGLNMGVVYAALPVGAATGCLYVVLDMVAILRGADPLREPEVGV